MSHDGDEHCHCVADHHPEPLELNFHHIWPLGLGGPDIPWNKVPLCPTTHANVHELLRLIVRAKGEITFRAVTQIYEQPVNPFAYNLAMEGWRRIIGESRP